jgi:hypothetical protein
MGHDECKGYKRLPSLQWWRRALMSLRFSWRSDPC